MTHGEQEQGTQTGTRLPPQTQEHETWMFTFGSGHLLGSDGAVLMHEMTYGEARQFIMSMIGTKWAFQYCISNPPLGCTIVHQNLSNYGHKTLYYNRHDSSTRFIIYREFFRKDLPALYREDVHSDS